MYYMATRWGAYNASETQGIRSSTVNAVVESFVVVFGYLIFSTEILKLIFSENAKVADPLVVKAVFFVFYLLIAALLLRKYDEAYYAVCSSPLLIFFIALPVLSVLWSISPTSSFVRSITLIGSSLFGVYMAVQAKPTRIIRLLAYGSVIAAIVSFLFIGLIPSRGIAQDGPWSGTWTGVYGHKNSLGAMTALGGLITITALREYGWRRSPLLIIGLCLQLVLLVASSSLTAQVMFAAGLFSAFFLGGLLRICVRNAVFLLVAVVPIVALMVASVDSESFTSLLALLGKDPTLSSRLPIWESLVPYIQQRLWLGWGYEAFWDIASTPARIIEFRLHFRPFYAHNGLVELWLGLGLVGITVFAVLWARHLLLVCRLLYMHPNNQFYAISIALIIVLTGLNLSENTILARNNIAWVLFVMMHVSLVRTTSHYARSD